MYISPTKGKVRLVAELGNLSGYLKYRYNAFRSEQK